MTPLRTALIATALATTATLGASFLAHATDVPFGAAQIVSSAVDLARGVEGADLDNDGDLDLVAGSALLDEIVWFENIDGTGTYGAKQVISTLADAPLAVAVADLDGDGDLDVLSTSEGDEKIAWYENRLDEISADFGAQQVISTLSGNPTSVSTADIDQDGDLDVLSTSETDSTISWYENRLDEPSADFGAQQVIGTAAGAARSARAADLDGDGDLDVLTAAATGWQIAWFENDPADTGAKGTFGPEQGITLLASSAMSARAADIDRDGDLDVVSASYGDDKIAWYENTDGQGSFGAQQVISTSGDGPRALSVADVDGDGDPDVVAGSYFDDEVAWYENTDGAGTFSTHVISSTADGAWSVFVGDVDGDGDADAVAAAFIAGEIAWYENATIHGSTDWSRGGPITTSKVGAEFAFAADLDGDGDLDAVAVSNTENTIVWYANTDGRGRFGPEQTIATGVQAAHSAFAADLDGDGDLDVLSASGFDDTIAWYANSDGLGSFGPEQTITDTADGAQSVFAADVDGDGDLDVLSASSLDDTVAWYPNTDGLGSFGPEQTITSTADNPRSVSAADLDGDGDLDVLVASYVDDSIAWYANTDGLGSFGPKQAITTTADGAASALALDVDGDGDLDVLSASTLDDTVAWYANTDGLGSFGPRQTISSTADGATRVFAGDVDGDGDLDVLSASLGDDTIAWYANTDGLGSFGPEQTITTQAVSARSVFAADLDGDGDLDVLSASANDLTVAWYENTDGLGAFSPAEITKGTELAGSIFAADIDGDGDLDALSASSGDDTVAWYANLDARGKFGPEQTVTTAADGARSVFAADVDGDGDLDALSASAGDDTIAWYENSDGLGSFGPEQIITTAADGAWSVLAADVDGDGDLDALSASTNDDTIAWYENTDGQGGFGPEQIITTAADGVRSVFAADVDGDGDLDALSASQYDYTIAWYANTDGLGSFGPRQTITSTASGARSVFAADVDGDGDLDALSASYGGDTIAWYPNTDGLGSFGPEQIITATAYGASSVFAGDADADGDVDVFSASQDDDTIAWYENTDGLGSFGPRQTISTDVDGAYSVLAADVDGDADLDLLFASLLNDRLGWYENLSGQVRLSSLSSAPGLPFQGTQIELLRIELAHRGAAGDAAAELDSLALQLDRVPATPMAVDPAGLLTSAEANALLENVYVYRDEGSGVFEPGSDALLSTIASLSLEDGVQVVDLPDGNADAQVAAGDSAIFFVVADLTATAGSSEPRVFRARHPSARTQVVHAGTSVPLSHAPGYGTQPRPITVLDPTADDDGDGLSNADERDTYGTNPLRADSDGDGLSDGYEVDTSGTDPLLADTDGDGLSDGDEVAQGTNPFVTDTDGDGLSDGDEIAVGANPLVGDTDGDGLSDGDEVNVHGTDPLDPNGDADGDTIPDAEEVARGMSPLESDTDADGVQDDVDNCPSAYNPNQLDQAGFGTATPDGVGDLCQNGDFNRDGQVDVLDVTLERRGLIGLEPTLDPALPPSAP